MARGLVSKPNLAHVRQHLARLVREVERLEPAEQRRSPARALTRRQVLLHFGANLRQARLAAGLTQNDLARAAGISNNHLSLLENGLRSPPLVLVLELARAAGVPVERLLDGLAAGPRPRPSSR